MPKCSECSWVQGKYCSSKELNYKLVAFYGACVPTDAARGLYKGEDVLGCGPDAKLFEPKAERHRTE